MSENLRAWAHRKMHEKDVHPDVVEMAHDVIDICRRAALADELAEALYNTAISQDRDGTPCWCRGQTRHYPYCDAAGEALRKHEEAKR